MAAAARDAGGQAAAAGERGRRRIYKKGRRPWGRGQGEARAVTAVETGAREACGGRSPAWELGDGGGVGWAVAWPGSWAGSVGEGSSFFLNIIFQTNKIIKAK